MHREGLLNVRKGARSTVGVDTPSLALACHRLDERRDARYSRRKILDTAFGHLIDDVLAVGMWVVWVEIMEEDDHALHYGSLPAALAKLVLRVGELRSLNGRHPNLRLVVPLLEAVGEAAMATQVCGIVIGDRTGLVGVVAVDPAVRALELVIGATSWSCR